MATYGFDPDELRRMRELMQGMHRSINNPAMLDIARTTEQMRKLMNLGTFKLPDITGTQQLAKMLNQNQSIMRQMSELYSFMPVLSVAQLPIMRNFALDTGAFQAAAAALRPIAPSIVNVDRLGERASRVTTVEEAEDAVEEALAPLDPAAAAELAAKLSGVIAAFLALLDTIGYDAKPAAALMAFISTLCWLYAHVEQHNA